MNVPNRISIFRLILIPIIVLVWIFNYANFSIEMPTYYIGHVSLPLKNIICLVLFAIASISDFLDGYIARKTNQITTFGKFIDPIADKALTTTMFLLFAASGVIPIVPVIIMVWRDIVVDGIRLISMSNNIVVSAKIWGKLKTVSQMLCICLILLNNLPFELIGLPIADIMLWFSMFMSVISGYNYFKDSKKVILNN